MLRRLRSRLTYANVIATLALFLALGGSSYALTVGSGSIKNNSIRSVDVRNGQLRDRDFRRGSIGGRAIRESRLGTVPSAFNLKDVQTVSASRPINPGTTPGGVPDGVTVTCPAGRRAVAGGGAWIIPGFGDGNQPTALERAYISASMPDGGGADNTDGNTGWKVFGRNTTNTPKILRAYALCARR